MILSEILTRLRAERKSNKEKANSIVVYVMLFPVIFGAFGSAVDLAIGTYTQTSLQSSLDGATQSALSRASNPGTNGNTTFTPKLTSAQAHTYIVDYYDANRKTSTNNSVPFIKCQTSPYKGGTFVQPPSGCGWTEQSYTYTTYVNRSAGRGTGIQLVTTVQVYEASHTVFLSIVGINQINYTIKSSARTTFATG